MIPWVNVIQNLVTVAIVWIAYTLITARRALEKLVGLIQKVNVSSSEEEIDAVLDDLAALRARTWWVNFMINNELKLVYDLCLFKLKAIKRMEGKT